MDLEAQQSLEVSEATMPTLQNSQDMDYEPLRRRGRNDRQAEEESAVNAYSVASPSYDERFAGLETGASEVKTNNINTPLNSVLKRGHALSFAGLFTFIALVYFRPYEWSPALGFLSTSAFWVAVLTLLAFVPTQLGLEGKLTVFPREVKLVLLLALTALLSITFALDRLIVWNEFIDYLKVVVMFIVMVNVVRTEKRLKALLLLALITSAIVSVAAVNDYRVGNLALGQKERIEGALGNLFHNPNDLALFLNTMLPIAFVYFLSSRAISKKVFYIALVVLFAAGIVCTTSRAGFIGLAFVVMALGWKLAKRYRFLLGGSALILILLLALFGPGGLRSRLAKGTDDASAITRTDELKRSIFLMVRHPVVGVGMNNYILYSNSNHATHNAYTQVGADLGIPALIFYVLFLITPIKRLANFRRKWTEADDKRRLRYLAIGIEVSLLAYMVNSFFLSVAFLWYAYFLVGYALILCRLISPADFASISSSQHSSERARTGLDAPLISDAN